MLSIYLYGKLRRFAPQKSPSGNSILQIALNKNETLQMVLKRIGIDPDELYTIFLNSKLLTSRTRIASFLGYQQVYQNNCQGWDLTVILQDGDRLGLFGPDMSGLVV